MSELLYSQDSVLIVAALFVCMLVFMEVGLRAGRRRHALATEPIRSQVNSVLASMLGLLALLLGFTFSLALQRYEDRSRAVVAESNAIGTTYLRSQLIPAEVGAETQDRLRQYLDTRIREGRVDLAEAAERKALNEQAGKLTAQLWDLAVNAAQIDGKPVSTGLFIQSLNELIDASDTRQAALNRHVPESVLLLLFATLVLTTSVLGYASGIAGHRVTMPAVLMVVLIALVVYLIIDLDKPRRGVIQVSQESLIELQRSIGATQPPAALPKTPPPPSPPAR